jgi:hypothetical protein|nr:hypothetical protein [Escherichia coli]UVY63512.1 MAG: hypothetical protein [Bacteriophage sp.]
MIKSGLPATEIMPYLDDIRPFFWLSGFRNMSAESGYRSDALKGSIVL